MTMTHISFPETLKKQMGGKEETRPMNHIGYYNQNLLPAPPGSEDLGGDFLNTESKKPLILGRKYRQLSTAVAQELGGLLSGGYTGTLFQCKL